ncbi:NAD-dependent succinate-semialdehyde dehydrogenase [Compostibacillus humi]|uniref:NAD-dependent succinate-semialdehyde dehydrogenase n=1 Tax=Compostibacillus humi TaxID=1245525 RepID=A0A8J2XIZ0_9BACI|nr:NAD-dependent succinate-semialdehyde dehydrogenase [Compostibacillus humi]GFZ85957.1 NAD-dependent succinate-semialdehyde dehydrogenase [Compostibacillus humi]HLT56344.1 NAD-dependent succinate-semialdehyde dehydrogenase [Bacillota bacterium]
MLYINGEWRNAYSNETMDVINPATGEVIAQVASGGSRETKEAIAAADAAFQEWKNTTAFDRAQYMKKVSELMRERAEDLAKTITMEMGKPINEARREVNSAINYNDWFLEEAKRVYGETVPASHQDKHLMVLREPVGVTAAITPWNFPLSMITRKISPAIAAGCTVIIKPAPATPLSAIKLFECFHDAGLPAGVVNLVIGPAEEIGSELTKSPIVRKLTFTGSTAVGKKLLRDSADTVKKVSMELGGHAPFIVFRDADLDLAVNSAVMTKFVNNGQTCICTNRIYVEESIAEEFGEKFAAKAKALRVGNGLNEEVQVGPLISEQSLKKVESHVQDALAHNGKLLCGGKRYESEGLNGYFYEPTVINYANEEMKIATEETFGPVAPIFSFSSEEEVIEKANQTNYGLAAYCFTKDLGKAFRMMKALEYGIVGINDPAPIVVQAPFGGYKESGIGREGGRSGILEYVEEKFVSIGGL